MYNKEIYKKWVANNPEKRKVSQRRHSVKRNAKLKEERRIQKEIRENNKYF